MVSPRYSVITAAELSRNLSAISATADTLVGFATVGLLSRLPASMESGDDERPGARSGTGRRKERASAHHDLATSSLRGRPRIAELVSLVRENQRSSVEQHHRTG